MNTLYLDCAMGAAGDMLAGALLGLVEDPQAATAAFNSFGLEGVEFSCQTLVKNGIAARRLRVAVRGEEEGGGHGRHHHEHRHLADVAGSIDALELDGRVKAAAKEVYLSIAAAEARAHGVAVDEVHFHETGALDAVADVCATCWLMDAIGADEVVVSPVNTGAGTVECAHGTLPVPAPATAFLLEGVPSYSDGIVQGELTTPTGAALLKHFATRFGARPPMVAKKTAFGAGTRDFPRPNVVCATLGEAFAAEGRDTVKELVFNIDDMTGEALSFAVDRLFEAGAKDVSVASVLMKKGRPGWTVTALCGAEAADAVAEAAFRHTSTIGMRERVCERRVARRSVGMAGDGARVKTSLAGGVAKRKAEADDAARIALARGISFGEAKRMVESWPG